MPYWRAFIHVVWATRGRTPLIGPTEESIILRSFTTTLDDLDVIPHAIGFMPDHVHLALSPPPAVAPAELVKRLKGASSHAVNHAPDRDAEAVFRWQDEYGYVTFGEKALPDVIRNVEDQPARHAAHRLWATLERDTDGKQPAAPPPLSPDEP